MRKGKASGVFLLEATVLGNLEVGQLEAGQPAHLVWKHIWLSLVGPELEEKAKMREAGVIDQVLSVVD